MKGVILYFSGTGNTKYVAKLLKKAFETKGCEIDLYSMEEDVELNPNCYDFLVLGFPKYYEHPPLKFIKFVSERVPTMSVTTKCVIFCTQCGPTKVPTHKLTKLMKQKNYEVVGSYLFQMANNYFLSKLFPPTTEFEIKIRNLNVKAKTEEIAQAFLKGEKKTESMGYVLDKICESFVALYKYTIPKDVLNIKTTPNCTKCGLCQKRCPVQNIKMTDSGPILDKNCMMCMRCINDCPHHAFTYKGQTLPQYTNLKMRKQ